MTNVIIRLKTSEIYKLVRNLLVRAFHSLLTLFAVSLLFNENDTVISAILIVTFIYSLSQAWYLRDPTAAF